MNKTDKELLFTQLLKKNKGKIHMMCRAFSDSEEATDDCFQEVAIRLWSGLSTFKNQSAIETWLYRVVLNTCISFNRHDSRIPKSEPIIVDVADDLDEDRNEQIEHLYELIKQLNRYDRALVLLWLENLSYAEIADIMGLTVSNVSVKLVRIKEKLKSLSKNI